MYSLQTYNMHTHDITNNVHDITNNVHDITDNLHLEIYPRQFVVYVFYRLTLNVMLFLTPRLNFFIIKLNITLA